MGCYFLLQGIFLTQGLKPQTLNWKAGFLPLSYLGSPSCTLLCCSRFITLFTQVIPKKQTHKNKHFKSYSFVTLKSRAVQYNSWAYRGWHPSNRQEEFLTEGMKGGGSWQSWRTVSNRRRRSSCSFTLAWSWWNACLHLWKFATWKFVCTVLAIGAIQTKEMFRDDWQANAP